MYSEASGLSSHLTSLVLYDGGIDRILNVGHRLVMVNICRSSQKRFGYALYRFEVPRGALRVAGRQAGVNNLSDII